MEEEWKLAEEKEANQKPEFLLPNVAIEVTEEHFSQEEDKQDDYSEMFGDHKTAQKGAYDGELNAMTFNHVKSSQAFTKKTPLFDISVMDQDDEFNRWLNAQEVTKTGGKLLARNSEDGWGKPSKGFKSFKHMKDQLSFVNNKSQLSFGGIDSATNQQQ